MVNKEFDFCVFGVTGVTGKYILKELKKNIGDDEVIKYAVSGRSVEKVKNVLKECGDEYKDIPIIEADVKDEKSLADMCKRCKVILNAVGPYRFFGEPVVKACVDNGSHHLDISGEPQYLETMQIKYHEAAKKAGVYIVGACGMDSIPCDMGIQFLKDKFQGDMNSVETYMSFETGPKGYNLNVGTWNSAIHGVANFAERTPLRKELISKIYPKGLPKLSPKLKLRGFMFRSKAANAWCFPFLGGDKNISERSQLSNFDIYNERPVHIQTYFKLSSFISGIVLAFMASIFALLSMFSFGRYFLQTYPGFFSLGLVREGGPTEEQMKDVRFILDLFGEGWSQKLGDPTEEHTDKPNKRLHAKVTGPDPAYFLTSIGIVQSALTILKELDKLPLTGGVFTTATAFKNTNLISNLHKAGLEFNIISD